MKFIRKQQGNLKWVWVGLTNLEVTYRIHVHSVEKISSFWSTIPCTSEKLIFSLVVVNSLSNSLLIMLFLLFSPLLLMVLFQLGLVKLIALKFWVQAHAIYMLIKGMASLITKICIRLSVYFKTLVLHFHQSLPVLLCPIRSRIFHRRAFKKTL